jgi:hypothetical protein
MIAVFSSSLKLRYTCVLIIVSDYLPWACTFDMFRLMMKNSLRNSLCRIDRDGGTMATGTSEVLKRKSG